MQRDWGFGGSTGVKSQWSVAGREAPGRPGGFVSSCLPLASNGSSLEQARFRMVDWLMSCGVRINGRGSNGGWVSGSLNQHLLSPPMGEALAESRRRDVTACVVFERVNCIERLLMISLFPFFTLLRLTGAPRKIPSQPLQRPPFQVDNDSRRQKGASQLPKRPVSRSRLTVGDRVRHWDMPFCMFRLPRGVESACSS